MTTDHVQHPVYIGIPYAVVYLQEYAVFRLDVVVLQDTTFVQHMNAPRILQYMFLHGLYLCRFKYMIQCSTVHYWATYRYNNVFGYGNVEHHDL